MGRFKILYSILIFVAYSLHALEPDPLPSWNEGDTKEAIFAFVKATTDKNSLDFVQEDERIACFDQDGTLWVEHPVYSQLIFCLDKVPDLVKQKPELADVEPFKTVLSGDSQAIAHLTPKELEQIAIATVTGMPVEQFQHEVTEWLSKAVDPRWRKPYTSLIYLPMKELLVYLRKNGFKTYIVTGGGQDFVRSYSEKVYGVPPEQVIGTALTTSYSYDASGRPVLTKEPKLLFNDNDAGKPEGIYLMIGRRPLAAFGNSTGDQQMLEYVKSANGNRFAALILHDDSAREYAYGPAESLPNTKVGTLTQELYDEAKASNWIVISMKRDWKRIFDF